ncbi:hypothetical protein FJZ28_03080 [Candidatus Peregrinibacteria bacterium]|nr:hypothetical protein [Candidatus Peregrinibacteria bacterium]
MHLRLSPCIGMPVVEEGTEDFLGSLSGVLIDPDVGRIEGMYVQIPGFFSQRELFCASQDILRFGTRVTVRSADAVCPQEEFIRLESLFRDPRTVLGQRIRTESGSYIGRCSDIQFETGGMRLEWIFPRRSFRWGLALPVSDIIEVKTDAIVVRDSAALEKEIEAEPAADEQTSVQSVPETA